MGQRLMIVLLLFSPSLVMAGELRGTITEGGKSIGAGATVEVHCGDKAYSTTTDRYGAYRLFVPDKGKCLLTLSHRNQSPSREVISFEDSTRYDMTLEQEGGRYVLRRK